MMEGTLETDDWTLNDKLVEMVAWFGAKATYGVELTRNESALEKK
jgi:hypothetical protein